MSDNCPWCDLEYELTTATEQAHLKVCKTFQSLPVAETSEDGRTYVAMPGYPDILVERERLQ